MAEFARIAGRAVVQAPVQDHAHAQSPADVDEKHVLFLLDHAGEVLAVGHGPGVVLDDHGDVQVLGEDLVDGAVGIEGVQVAVARLRIHAACDADAHPEHAVPVQVVLHEKVADVLRDGVEAGFVNLQDKRNVVLAADQGALEVRDGDAGVRVPDVQADEIAGSGVQPIDAGPAAAGRAGFAEFDHEAFVHELADELRDGRYAGVDLLAEGRDAIFPTLDAKTQDGLFEDGILVVFFV